MTYKTTGPAAPVTFRDAPTTVPCTRRSDTPKQFGAKHQTCSHFAVHQPPDSTLEMGAAEMGAAIRCPVVGDSPRGKETAEPLTSTPEPWSPPSSCFRQWQGPCSISDLSVRLSPSTRERLP